MTTDPKLAEIRERAEKATPGPWRELHSEKENPSWVEVTVGNNKEKAVAQVFTGERGAVATAWGGDIGVPQHEANATFIAHARSDIPYLLAKVDELTLELADESLTGNYARDQVLLIDNENVALRERLARAEEALRQILEPTELPAVLAYQRLRDISRAYFAAASGNESPVALGCKAAVLFRLDAHTNKPGDGREG